MTQEQFNRAIEIYKRLENLAEAKKRIASKDFTSLWFAEKIRGSWELIGGLGIHGILARHEDMIRKEIDEEIENLNEEIRSL